MTWNQVMWTFWLYCLKTYHLQLSFKFKIIPQLELKIWKWLLNLSPQSMPRKITNTRDDNSFDFFKFCWLMFGSFAFSLLSALARQMYQQIYEIISSKITTFMIINCFAKLCSQKISVYHHRQIICGIFSSVQTITWMLNFKK